jgi:hypothetical protein
MATNLRLAVSLAAFLGMRFGVVRVLRYQHSSNTRLTPLAARLPSLPEPDLRQLTAADNLEAAGTPRHQARTRAHRHGAKLGSQVGPPKYVSLNVYLYVGGAVDLSRRPKLRPDSPQPSPASPVGRTNKG